jgi:hypothetical protein
MRMGHMRSIRIEPHNASWMAADYGRKVSRLTKIYGSPFAKTRLCLPVTGGIASHSLIYVIVFLNQLCIISRVLR